ncbi:MAG TPA: DUF2064 domain-containing protein [Chthoniobacterales bacterium]
MKTKAVLIFADALQVDLVKRGLPVSLQSLVRLPVLGSECGADVHLFTSAMRESSPNVHVHSQHGATFAERLERATDEVAALGYEQIVIVGRDCPLLENADINRAFSGLTTRQLVLGPDHRGGCYLIGLRASNRSLLRGVCWKRNTDCRQLIERAGGDVLLLPIKQDVDSWRDLSLLARSSLKLGRLLRLLLERLLSLGRDRFEVLVDPARKAIRVRQQIPPPVLAT